MKKLGFVGWRGMVGSVLFSRMLAENDFERGIDPTFFSTSQAGSPGPEFRGKRKPLGDANAIAQLLQQDIIISCQGSAYTEAVHPELRRQGWQGYWIDAASSLRMAQNSVIPLDPVNQSVILAGLKAGKKDFIGGNCTVSLMLMAIAPLFADELIEWIQVSSYQAISGAGAGPLKEFLQQTQKMGKAIGALDFSQEVIALETQLRAQLPGLDMPQKEMGGILVANLFPWIDSAADGGHTREEQKGLTETNKIMGTHTLIPVDSTCVRVPSIRCHSQAITMKLRKATNARDIEQKLVGSHPWLRLIPNDRAATIRDLTPLAVTGSLNIHVGRIRTLNRGADYVSLFTVGDQLLWGAAEPLRRVLNIILDHAV